MIHHRGTEGNGFPESALSDAIIGAGVEVHRSLGPGLLESAYHTCLAHELGLRGLDFVEQVPVPLTYKGIRLDAGYRVDFIVARSVVVEVKAVETLAPIHKAQLLTYLGLLRIRVGLLINFNVGTLVHGVRRLVRG